jgi:glycosyltransferase involved in cell wall biosynthesis
MPSVVIAAHDEQAVIGRTLRSLQEQKTAEPLEIVVSANGCTDDTVGVARSFGVEVIDRPEPGKAAAINAAEDVATALPRIYLDADIVVPPDGVEALLAPFSSDLAPLAVVPRRRIDVARRPILVRSYIAINRRLPAFRDGLFGRGMIALSAEGRERFDRFPTMIADDLFLDSQFAASEKAEAQGVEVVVQAPFTTRALLNRLVRVRRGNTQLRAASASVAPVRASDKWAWFRDVVVPEPRLIFPAIPYVALTVIAALMARRQRSGEHAWGKDDSTRRIDEGAS